MTAVPTRSSMSRRHNPSVGRCLARHPVNRPFGIGERKMQSMNIVWYSRQQRQGFRDQYELMKEYTFSLVVASIPLSPNPSEAVWFGPHAKKRSVSFGLSQVFCRLLVGPPDWNTRQQSRKKRLKRVSFFCILWPCQFLVHSAIKNASTTTFFLTSRAGCRHSHCLFPR